MSLKRCLQSIDPLSIKSSFEAYNEKTTSLDNANQRTISRVNYSEHSLRQNNHRRSQVNVVPRTRKVSLEACRLHLLVLIDKEIDRN